MSILPKPILSIVAGIAFLGCCNAMVSSAHAQTWLERVGYNQLAAEYGAANIERGAGISLSMVESDFDTDPAIFSYMPDDTMFFDPSQTIVDGSGLQNGAFSAHATGQARLFFGDASIADEGTGATVFETNDFINRVLSVSNGLEPLAQTAKVQNHSWIGNFGNSASQIAAAENTLQRLDYVINRDEMSVVVAVNNRSFTRLPQLLSQSYNSIAVGRSDGDHSRGETTIYGVGRTKPDVVNFEPSTSAATSRTSSVLAVLHEKAIVEGNADASRAVTMKSILMAGATKNEFADWDRTITRPLDEIYGAGEVNIYNSYKILEAGETDGSLTAAGATTIDVAGFDYGETLDAADTMYYSFEIGDNEKKWQDVSLMLNWNIDVLDSDAGAAFDPTTSLADFSLRVFDSTGGLLNTLLDSSLSTVDNVEHIYFEELGAGLYTVEITTDTTHDFAFSWYAQSVPEPSSAVLILAVGGLLATRRRRNL